jgi:hypothetical protein
VRTAVAMRLVMPYGFATVTGGSDQTAFGEG